MRLEKNINKVNDKSYTNYILIVPINDREYRVPITLKTFGKDWTHPKVRANFTILDLISTLVIKDNNVDLENKDKEEEQPKGKSSGNKRSANLPF